VPKLTEGRFAPGGLFSFETPGIQIESIGGYRVDFVDAIQTGTLDLAFCVYPVSEPDTVVVPICPVEVVFVARRGHPKIG